ncbi:MAG: hypothetical protein HYW65_01605 [Candidatus Liptonbacteria bacterium]|nr:hypothetical protein [Candidatus Liptonbacteria bacterium]
MRYRIPKRGEIAWGKGWSFARINGRYAEIYFNEKGIYGHCYVNRREYSVTEQRMMDTDIKRCTFTYRGRLYFDQRRGIKSKIAKIREKKENGIDSREKKTF